MREILDYDDVYKALCGDFKDDFEEKRFAIGVLAARIYEELVLWQRIAPLLESMKNYPLEPDELDEYNILSKKSESLTKLIVRSVKELGIKDNKSIQELMDKLDEQMLDSDSNGDEKDDDGTTPNDS